MFLTIAIVATLIVVAFTLFVRRVPEAPAPLPYAHLEGRKAAIYENLRDLQFEYRVGKLSDADYERTKKGLQAELAAVLAEIDSMKTGASAASTKVSKNGPAPAAAETGTLCPHCGAKFDKALKFCGECGKSMTVNA